MKLIQIIFFSVLLLLTGCLSRTIVPVDEQYLQEKKLQTITNAKRPNKPIKTPAGEARLTAAIMVGGAVGGILTTLGEEAWRADFQDPGPIIAQKVALFLAPQLNLQYKNNEINWGWSAASESDEASSASEMYDLIVDAENINWAVLRKNPLLNKNTVLYQTNLYVFDSKTNVRVATSFCEYKSEVTYKSHELFENNASLLKEISQKIVEKCTKDITESLAIKDKKTAP